MHFPFFRSLFLTLVSCVIIHTHANAQNATPLQGPNAFKNESEAGLVVTSGNTKTQSYNLMQTNSYTFSKNTFAFKGRYLRQISNGVLNARPWSLGIRYERELTERLAIYLGQILESDIFAGYVQRYHTDLGGKFQLIKSDELTWFAESGYRYTRENRKSGEKKKYHYLRLYTEAQINWNKSVSSKFWIEGLPNLTTSEDYQINGELSTLAQLNSIFSVKLAYLLRFDNLPAPGASRKTDSTYTTSLVAKF